MSMGTIIIGAGAAGITAGYTLLQQGYNDFIILEASSTYLGRIQKNDTFADFPIDIGAEWIHTDPIILQQIVNNPNISVDIETTPYDAKYFEWDGVTLNEASLPSGDYKFTNYTWYDFFDDYIVTDVLDKIVFDCAVSNVVWSNATTMVTCDNGQTFPVSKVIITVPMSVLQDEDIIFEPELPVAFIGAINKPIMAPGLKIFLSFQEKFYPDAFSVDADFENLEYSESERFFYDATFGQRSSDNIMGVFIIGEVAEPFLALSENDIIQSTLSDLNTIFGNKVATNNFIRGFVQNWVDEPFIRGAYTFYEDKYRAIDVLRQPLQERLYFAGEAIPNADTDYANGFAHGAALSGRRAALETLGAPTSGPQRRLYKLWLGLSTAVIMFLNF